MQLNPYLIFNGNCEAAFRFYERCLGGKIAAMLTHEGSPMPNQGPPGWGKKILHARLTAGNSVLMGSDSPPEHYQKPAGFYVAFAAEAAADAERIFQALAENGTVQMPMQETFWAVRFGMLTDQFGIPWMVSYERPA